MGQDTVDKLVDGAVRGAAIGAGVEAIRGGRQWQHLADGMISGIFLGAAWKGMAIVSDRTGLTASLIRAKNKIVYRTP